MYTVHCTEMSIKEYIGLYYIHNDLVGEPRNPMIYSAILVIAGLAQTAISLVVAYYNEFVQEMFEYTSVRHWDETA